ncbi:MAG: hypothetical protein ABUK01_14760, partial [Leptospirales bacterium]
MDQKMYNQNAQANSIDFSGTSEIDRTRPVQRSKALCAMFIALLFSPACFVGDVNVDVVLTDPNLAA